MLYTISTNTVNDTSSFIFFAVNDLEAAQEYFDYKKKTEPRLSYQYTLDLICYETNLVLISNTYRYSITDDRWHVL